MNVGSDEDGGVDNLVLDYRDRLGLVAMRHCDLLYCNRRESRAGSRRRAETSAEQAISIQASSASYNTIQLLQSELLRRALASAQLASSTMAAVSFNQPDLLQPYKDIIAGGELAIPLPSLCKQLPAPPQRLSRPSRLLSPRWSRATLSRGRSRQLYHGASWSRPPRLVAKQHEWAGCARVTTTPWGDATESGRRRAEHVQVKSIADTSTLLQATPTMLSTPSSLSAEATS